MKTYKLLLVVAFVGVLVVPADAGDLRKRVRERAIERALPLPIATGLNSCLADGLDNITTCSDGALRQADGAGYDVDFAFWACVEGAEKLFDQCPADNLDLSVEAGH